MYVCLCKGISNRVVRRCIDEGARSLDDLGQRCGAGTVCGTCRVDLDGMLQDARDARAARACDRPSGGEPLAAK